MERNANDTTLGRQWQHPTYGQTFSASVDDLLTSVTFSSFRNSVSECPEGRKARFARAGSQRVPKRSLGTRSKDTGRKTKESNMRLTTSIHTVWIVLGALLLACDLTPQVHAQTPVLDQQYIIGTSGPGNRPDREGVVVENEYNSVAQTFTVGIGGTLSSIALQLGTYSGTGGTIDVNIFGTASSGLPAGDSLASASIGWSTLPTWSFYDPSAIVPFNLSSSHLSITAGAVLAIVVSSTPGANAAMDSYYPGGYLGGAAFGNYSGSWQPMRLSMDGIVVYGDVGFKTYVTPTPEPTSILLLLGGTALLGLLHRRRQNVHA
jgi:hypothetical protein